MRTKLFLFVITLALTVSCNKNNGVVILSDAEQLEKDVAEIDAYLLKNNITAIRDPNGMRYVIHREGAGTVSPTTANCVLATYIGKKIVDDTEFEKNTNAKLCISVIIEGWQIGLSKMQVGDSATFYIPSNLAYRARTSHQLAGENLCFSMSFKSIGDPYWNSALGKCSCVFEGDPSRNKQTEEETLN